jgi:hypothetical protein
LPWPGISVDGAEQDCRDHGEQNCPVIATDDGGEPVGHAAIQPVLNGDERLHRLFYGEFGPGCLRTMEGNHALSRR